MAIKSAKNSNPAVKKNKGQKCVNYLDLPVCPNCGSPNLHELERDGNVTNCVCDRCYTPCWFDDSFSTEGRDTMRYTDNLKIVESTKKSKNTQLNKKASINKRIGRATLTNLETNEAREIDNNEFLEILNRNPSSRIKFRDVVMRYAPEGGTVGYRDIIDGVKYLVDVYGEPSEPLWASVRKSATAKSFNDMVQKQRNRTVKKYNANIPDDNTIGEAESQSTDMELMAKSMTECIVKLYDGNTEAFYDIDLYIQEICDALQKINDALGRGYEIRY